jgi:hypothetical protein
LVSSPGVLGCYRLRVDRRARGWICQTGPSDRLNAQSSS